MNGKIYLITCLINDKKYVGQTIGSVEKRWKKHIKGNWDKNIEFFPIQRSFKKHGIENFKIDILEENIEEQNKLDDAEIHYSEIYNSLVPNGYNLRVGNARGKVSDEIKEKISKANKGRPRTEIWLKRSSDSHMGNKHTEETKKKISDFFKNKKPSENTRLGSIEKNSKDWEFVSPDKELTKIKNLKQFCKDKDLSYSEMYSLDKGTRKTPHKGWSKFIEENYTNDYKENHL